MTTPSFHERLKRLEALTKREIEQASQPDAKRKRIAQSKAAAKEYTESLLRAELNKTDEQREHEAVLKSLSPLLEWKLRPKSVVRALRHSALNTNYLVEVKGEGRFVLRRGVTHPRLRLVREALGLHRQREYNLAALLGRSNLAPPCVHHLRETDVFVTRFLDGFVPWDSCHLREDYRLCVELLKRLHAVGYGELPSDGLVPFNVFDQCDERLAFCQSSPDGPELLPASLDQCMQVMRDWHKLLVSRPPPPESATFVVCHNDLQASNIIVKRAQNIAKDETQLKLVDFDYATIGDRFFDLAQVSRLNEFDENDDVLLLKMYFGRFDGGHMVRLQLLKSLGDLYEALRTYALLAAAGKPVDLSQSSASADPLTPANSCSDFPPTPPPTPVTPVTTTPTSVVEKIEGLPPFILPDGLRERADLCYARFEKKALSQEYTEYLRSALS
eukprot:TRINITY_DN13446_c0_g2_i1.p1 TRINITY_DN13446_c0_g2~~TRINITY_DN13446_c0_g2_i1.p1  ORF type:complete len:444 (+),score=78.26 TRINITY_DN13446_c0_g2_i1:27-1358(+)